MHVSAIIPFRGEVNILNWVLEGFARQQLPAGMTLDVRVGGDGCPVPEPPPPVAPGVRFTMRQLPHLGISEAKNLLLRDADGDILLFVNGDTRPAADFVARHVARLTSLPAGSMVLGASPYVMEPGTQETVFDVLKRDTPMIFFYALLQPDQQYDYRHAWNMNVSVRRADVVAAGGFSTALRPVFYDDIELAFRIMGTTPRVYFEPRAVVEHRHPMTIDGYLMREELLGLMAPVLAQVNPAMFAALFGGKSVTELSPEFAAWVQMDRASHTWIYRRVQEWATLDARVLGEGPDRQRLLNTIYQMHIPLKRLAFRLGFLRGVASADDGAWAKRQPVGEWKIAIGTANGEPRTANPHS